MGVKEANFIRKHGILYYDIMYMMKSDRKTVIHYADGKTLATHHTIKGLLEEFPEGSFSVINKGIAIAPQYVHFEAKNTYMMADGVSFTGRVHRKRSTKPESHAAPEMLSWRQFEIVDKLPIAFCVIELIFNERHRGIDFIFRYCNKMMERLEGKRMEEMLNRSFYDVFENGDKKWLPVYANVALNGTTQVIESFSPEINKNLRIYCYQPRPNFCACALIEI